MSHGYSGRGLVRSHSLTSLRHFESNDGSSATSSAGVSPTDSPSPAGEQRLLPCRLLLTADRQNIDWDILQAVQEAGLVYDGRMIVRHDFSVGICFRGAK